MRISVLDVSQDVFWILYGTCPDAALREAADTLPMFFQNQALERLHLVAGEYADVVSLAVPQFSG